MLNRVCYKREYIHIKLLLTLYQPHTPLLVVDIHLHRIGIKGRKEGSGQGDTEEVCECWNGTLLCSTVGEGI